MTQEHAVLMLLRSRPQTTHDFIASLYGLAAEYRKIISLLRKKGYTIQAKKLRRGCWEYRLLAEPMKTEPSGQLLLGLAGGR